MPVALFPDGLYALRWSDREVIVAIVVPILYLISQSVSNDIAKIINRTLLIAKNERQSDVQSRFQLIVHRE